MTTIAPDFIPKVLVLLIHYFTIGISIDKGIIQGHLPHNKEIIHNIA